MAGAFHRGRVALIEDGVVLARLVSARPVPEALADYTRVRLPRTTRIVRRSLSVARLHNTTTPLGCALRDRALWLGTRLPPSVSIRSVDFIYNWRPSG
jgi:2-polyprenyl-6-methoxyphenol hydroxylase-like FAD-dependent oxidoreductase